LRRWRNRQRVRLLARLRSSNEFEVVDVPGIGACVARAQLADYCEPAISDMRARLMRTNSSRYFFAANLPD
jgi:hypothetical protein